MAYCMSGSPMKLSRSTSVSLLPRKGMCLWQGKTGSFLDPCFAMLVTVSFGSALCHGSMFWVCTGLSVDQASDPPTWHRHPARECTP